MSCSPRTCLTVPCSFHGWCHCNLQPGTGSSGASASDTNICHSSCPDSGSGLTPASCGTDRCGMFIGNIYDDTLALVRTGLEVSVERHMRGEMASHQEIDGVPRGDVEFITRVGVEPCTENISSRPRIEPRLEGRCLTACVCVRADLILWSSFSQTCGLHHTLSHARTHACTNT